MKKLAINNVIFTVGIFTAFLILISTGCGQRNLNKSLAMELIIKYEKDEQPEYSVPIYLQEEHLILGMEHGLFKRFENKILNIKGYIPTDKGKYYFVDWEIKQAMLDPYGIRICKGGWTCTRIYIRAKAKIKKVTGLTGEDTKKVVEFESKPELPEIINELYLKVAPPPPGLFADQITLHTLHSLREKNFAGTAVFQLYEDGWRIIDISY